MSIPTLKAPNENGVYKAVQANEDGNMPVVKAWDKTSQQYVPVFALMGGSGVELPELTNPGTAANLESGYQLIDGDGNVVEGTAAVAKTAIVAFENYAGMAYLYYIAEDGQNATYMTYSGFEKTFTMRTGLVALVAKGCVFGTVTVNGSVFLLGTNTEKTVCVFVLTGSNAEISVKAE